MACSNCRRVFRAEPKLLQRDDAKPSESMSDGAGSGRLIGLSGLSGLMRLQQDREAATAAAVKKTSSALPKASPHRSGDESRKKMAQALKHPKPTGTPGAAAETSAKRSRMILAMIVGLCGLVTLVGVVLFVVSRPDTEPASPEALPTVTPSEPEAPGRSGDDAARP